MNPDTFFVLIRFPEGAKPTDDVPPGYVPPAIGTRRDIISKLKAAVPGIAFQSVTKGKLEGDKYSIELNLCSQQGDDNDEELPIDCIGLSLKLGNSPGGLYAVGNIAEALGVFAMPGPAEL